MHSSSSGEVTLTTPRGERPQLAVPTEGLKIWVSQVTGQLLPDSADLFDLLRSGVLLVRLLVNGIRPGIVQRYNTAPRTALEEVENIAHYLKACWELGLPSSCLFTTSSLYLRHDMSLVLLNIEALARTAASLPDYDGPLLVGCDPLTPQHNRKRLLVSLPNLVTRSQTQLHGQEKTVVNKSDDVDKEAEPVEALAETNPVMEGTYVDVDTAEIAREGNDSSPPIKQALISNYSSSPHLLHRKSPQHQQLYHQLQLSGGNKDLLVLRLRDEARRNLCLTERVASLEERLHITQTEHDSVKRELERDRSELERIQQNVAEKIALLKAERKALKQRELEAQERKEKAEIRAEGLLRTLKDRDASRYRLEEEITLWKKKVSSMRRMDENKKELEAELKFLESLSLQLSAEEQAASEKKEQELLTQERNQMQEQIAVAQEKYKEEKKKKKSVKKELSEVKELLEQQKKEAAEDREALKQRTSQVETSLKELRSRLEEALQDKAQMEALLEKRLSEEVEIKTRLDMTNHELKQLLTQKELMLKKTSQEVQDLKRDIVRLKQQQEELKNANKEMEEEKQSWEKQAQRANKKAAREINARQQAETEASFWKSKSHCERRAGEAGKSLQVITVTRENTTNVLKAMEDMEKELVKLKTLLANERHLAAAEEEEWEKRLWALKGEVKRQKLLKKEALKAAESARHSMEQQTRQLKECIHVSNQASSSMHAAHFLLSSSASVPSHRSSDAPPPSSSSSSSSSLAIASTSSASTSSSLECSLENATAEGEEKQRVEDQESLPLALQPINYTVAQILLSAELVSEPELQQLRGLLHTEHGQRVFALILDALTQNLPTNVLSARSFHLMVQMLRLIITKAEAAFHNEAARDYLTMKTLMDTTSRLYYIFDKGEEDDEEKKDGEPAAQVSLSLCEFFKEFALWHDVSFWEEIFWHSLVIMKRQRTGLPLEEKDKAIQGSTSSEDTSKRQQEEAATLSMLRSMLRSYSVKMTDWRVPLNTVAQFLREMALANRLPSSGVDELLTALRDYTDDTRRKRKEQATTSKMRRFEEKMRRAESLESLEQLRQWRKDKSNKQEFAGLATQPKSVKEEPIGQSDEKGEISMARKKGHKRSLSDGSSQAILTRINVDKRSKEDATSLKGKRSLREKFMSIRFKEEDKPQAQSEKANGKKGSKKKKKVKAKSASNSGKIKKTEKLKKGASNASGSKKKGGSLREAFVMGVSTPFLVSMGTSIVPPMLPSESLHELFFRINGPGDPAVANPDPTQKSKSTQVFGVPIRKLVEREGTTSVPRFVKEVVRFLMRDDVVQTVGLFRLSASKAGIDQFKKRYDSGDYPDLSKEKASGMDPHIIAVLLKKFLQMLPEPLLTFALWDSFVALLEKDSQKEIVDGIKSVLEQLPSTNKAVLKEVLRVCVKVDAFSAINKMTVKNLAIVIGPNICYPKNQTLDDPQQVMEQVNTANEFVERLILYFEDFFLNEGEVIELLDPMTIEERSTPRTDDTLTKTTEKEKEKQADPSAFPVANLKMEREKRGMVKSGTMDLFETMRQGTQILLRGDQLEATPNSTTAANEDKGEINEVSGTKVGNDKVDGQLTHQQEQQKEQEDIPSDKEKKVASIIQSWYASSQAGSAIVESPSRIEARMLLTASKTDRLRMVKETWKERVSASSSGSTLLSKLKEDKPAKD
ncbi:Type II inositol 1,4,5-trisphosphate 5-phosphatase [Balamuthia mandrillaris]